jgi:hypothetical protein
VIMCVCAGNQLDSVISDIVSSTPCPCDAATCNKHNGGYRIGVALVGSMQQGANVTLGNASDRLVLVLCKHILHFYSLEFTTDFTEIQNGYPCMGLLKIPARIFPALMCL